jgi:TolB protein
MTTRADGSDLAALTTDGVSNGAAWSPDGSLLAYSHPVAPGKEWGIWTMLPDGTQQTLAIDVGGNALGPSWSPDGTRILFTGDSLGNMDVWVADANGDHARDLTPGWSDRDTAIGWAPDGSVIFASDRSHTGGTIVYAMAADGSDVRLVVII